MRRAMNSFAVFAALAMAATSAHAADFYAGKTVDFVVGADVGGGFDIYARTISRHIGRFIPGKPTFVPRNSPGAGSAVAAASLYRTAPKDGGTIAALMPGAVMENLLNDRAPKLFDAPKFAYLASADSGTQVLLHIVEFQDQVLRRPDRSENDCRRWSRRLHAGLRLSAPQRDRCEIRRGQRL